MDNTSEHTNSNDSGSNQTQSNQPTSEQVITSQNAQPQNAQPQNAQLQVDHILSNFIMSEISRSFVNFDNDQILPLVPMPQTIHFRFIPEPVVPETNSDSTEPVVSSNSTEPVDPIIDHSEPIDNEEIEPSDDVDAQPDPADLDYLTNINYIIHFDFDDTSQFVYNLQNVIMPALYENDLTNDQFYSYMAEDMMNHGYSREETYWGIGGYLEFISLHDNREEMMDYVRRQIRRNYRIEAQERNMAQQLMNRFSQISQSDMNSPAHQLLNILGLINQANQFNQVNMEPVKLTVSKTELDKIPLVEFQSLSHDIKQMNDGCPICQSNYESNDKVRHLKCNHVFHSECIDKWLLENSYTCPVCRADAADHIANL